MTAMCIKTNNVPRETFSGLMAELYIGAKRTAKLRQQFDYLTETEFEDETFVEYKGYFYSLSDFMCTPSACDGFEGWDGYHGDSYFSGVLIKLRDDGDVIMGRYYC